MTRPIFQPRKKLNLLVLVYMISYHSTSGNNDIWPMERPKGMPAIQSLEVMCGKDHMDVHLTFSQPFEGIVSSKGQHGDPRCVYVPPSTGKTFFSFRIAYARCGTKPDLHGQFYENTVVVQYDKDLLEVWDEAKRLRCEWYNDYEKTASKPPMVIADLDVIQLDFRGDNVDCWMEIQHGKGPWAPPVSGIVPLGSTLTLVVAINDFKGEFDMRVKSCVASDGGIHVIQLSDEFGCVLRPKMISRFLKARGADERASVITYAFFHAFKFPDALSVHIKCKVEICRHGCLDHCQTEVPHIVKSDDIDSLQQQHPDSAGVVDLSGLGTAATGGGGGGVPPLDFLGALDRKDHLLHDDLMYEKKNPMSAMKLMGAASADNSNVFLLAPPDHFHRHTAEANRRPEQGEDNDGDDDYHRQQQDDVDVTAVPHKDLLLHDKFPHGPRTIEDDDDDEMVTSSEENNHQQHRHQRSSGSTDTVRERKRRSVVVSDRKVRSADVGVSGLYDVISEVDLAFSPETRSEAVTVFQGKISNEEVVYGICMPVPGFSILFALVAISAVMAALTAGYLFFRYQVQKENLLRNRQTSSVSTSAEQPPPTAAYGWIGTKFLQMRILNPPLRQQHQQPPTSANGSVPNGKTLVSAMPNDTLCGSRQ